MAKIDRAAKVQLLADFDAQYAAFVTAGMDEAGRGPLVGNVVAACVVMPKEPLILWVDDSKKLSEKRRESVYAEIMERALYVGIGQATPEEIDRMNILEATKKAMREASASRCDSLPAPSARRGVPHRRGEESGAERARNSDGKGRRNVLRHCCEQHRRKGDA